MVRQAYRRDGIPQATLFAHSVRDGSAAIQRRALRPHPLVVAMSRMTA